MGCGGSKTTSTVPEKSNNNPTKEQGRESNIVSKESVEEEEYNFKPVHSAVRWKKPLEEIEALLNSSPKAVNCVDTVIFFLLIIIF